MSRNGGKVTQTRVFHRIMKELGWKGPLGLSSPSTCSRRGQLQSSISFVQFQFMKLGETEAARFQWRGAAARMIKTENFGH